MDVKLVGTMGVGRMHLVGGPMDGETRIAVVGAPIVVPVPKREEEPREMGGFYFVSFGSGPIEGDEWKNEAKAKGSDKERAQLFAVYAPVVRDGKATGALAFVGLVDWVPLP